MKSSCVGWSCIAFMVVNIVLSNWSTRPKMNRKKKGRGSEYSLSCDARERPHIKLHTHTHTKSTHDAWNFTNGRPRVTSLARREHTEGHATHSPLDLKTRRSHTHLATQCGILLPVFRALVFGLALCFGGSINLTWLTYNYIMPNFFKMAITFGHRFLMRSNSQKMNGIDALFKSTRPHIFLKIWTKPSQHVSFIDLAKLAPRITKIWICITNS